MNHFRLLIFLGLLLSVQPIAQAGSCVEVFGSPQTAEPTKTWKNVSTEDALAFVESESHARSGGVRLGQILGAVGSSAELATISAAENAALATLRRFNEGFPPEAREAGEQAVRDRFKKQREAVEKKQRERLSAFMTAANERKGKRPVFVESRLTERRNILNDYFSFLVEDLVVLTGNAKIVRMIQAQKRDYSVLTVEMEGKRGDAARVLEVIRTHYERAIEHPQFREGYQQFVKVFLTRDLAREICSDTGLKYEMNLFVSTMHMRRQFQLLDWFRDQVGSFFTEEVMTPNESLFR